MTELREQLQKLSFWEHLSPLEKQKAEDYAIIRKYQKNSILHPMDGDCLGLAAVLEGSVRAYMVSDEGKEITLYHIRAGECDVLTAACILYQVTFETQMVIEEDSRILILPTIVLKELKENNNYVRSFIYETLTRRFSDVMWTIQQVLFYGIDQRTAAFLISHAENGEVRATHRQIAREINSAREVVARIIKRFVDDGLVRTSRGKITITDPEGLRNITEDSLLK